VNLLAPLDAAAPPQGTWGPFLVVALVVVAVVAMIIGFGRITRRRASDASDAEARGGSTADAAPPDSTGNGSDPGPDATATDDPLPTDPQ